MVEILNKQPLQGKSARFCFSSVPQNSIQQAVVASSQNSQLFTERYEFLKI